MNCPYGRLINKYLYSDSLELVILVMKLIHLVLINYDTMIEKLYCD